jgi:hypothetical protein
VLIPQGLNPGPQAPSMLGARSYQKAITTDFSAVNSEPYGNCLGLSPHYVQYWFCFRSFLNSIDYFSNCPNNASLQKALEAYSYFLSTTVPGAEGNCQNPCQFSLVRPKTYFTIPFVATGCLGFSPTIYSVTLRMPTTILLTETTFSYPFMTFAAELGGNTKINMVLCLFFIYKRYLLKLSEH